VGRRRGIGKRIRYRKAAQVSDQFAARSCPVHRDEKPALWLDFRKGV